MTNADTADTDFIPQRQPLENSPLVEAIFEIRWAINKEQKDPGFRVLVGKYYDQIKKNYPVLVDLPVSQVPEELTPYVVRHQFWKQAQSWPVTQVGPGVMTFNDTSDYVWETFRPRLIDVVTALYQSYPTEIAPFNPTQVSLRYIDAVSLDSDRERLPLLAFLQDRLHFSVDLEPKLFHRNEDRQNPLALNIAVSYPLHKPTGFINLTFTNGTVERDGKQMPSMIWETTVLSKDTHLPNDVDGWTTWIDQAHDVSDRWFFTLIRGHLFEKFKTKHADRKAELQI